jgi:peptide/nickel transport system permease protein
MFSETQGRVGRRDNVMTDEQLAARRASLGLDQPFYVQYFRWLNRVFVHGDLGTALISRAPVTFLIIPRMWNSILLNLFFFFF